MRQDKVSIRLTKDKKSLLDSIPRSKSLPIASWARRESVKTARDQISKAFHTETISGKRTNSLRLLSLFCGPGGLDLGFGQAGFQTQVAIDNDQECVNTFKRNHPTAVVRQADISKISIQDIDEMAGEQVTPIGIIGGPPCQSFSVSNVHQQDNDPRNKLPEHYAILLKALNERNPISFFLFENVLGLLGKKHRARYEKFKSVFEDAGFKIYEKTLDAKHYGVPQVRSRIFIVGINNHKHPGSSWQAPAKTRRRLTVRDAIGKLPEPVYSSQGMDPNMIPVHPNHWCMVPRSEKFTNGNMDQGSVLGRCFRVLLWDEPSWTVAYGHREVHIHPNGGRRLSIYEAMLLQSFPKEYVLTGNISAQVRLVSDAVPPRLARQVARSIRRSLEI